MYNFGARKPERMYNIGAHTHTAHVTDRTTRPAKAHERGQRRAQGVILLLGAASGRWNTQMWLYHLYHLYESTVNQ